MPENKDGLLKDLIGELEKKKLTQAEIRKELRKRGLQQIQRDRKHYPILCNRHCKIKKRALRLLPLVVLHWNC